MLPGRFKMQVMTLKILLNVGDAKKSSIRQTYLKNTDERVRKESREKW